MKINKTNYEIYFIDYHDGNLSAEDVAELFLFLESNPALKQEFEKFSPITLDAPETVFPERDSLRKGEISLANIQNYLAASLEGDLSSEETAQLEKFLQENSQFRQDEILYKKTILAPDYSIVYPEKKSLKQPVPLFVEYRNITRYAIAAVLLLAFITGSVLVFNRIMDRPSTRLAEQPVTNVPHDKIEKPNSSEKSGSGQTATSGAEKTDSVTENKKNTEKRERTTVPDIRKEMDQTASITNRDSGVESIIIIDAIPSGALASNDSEIKPVEKSIPVQTNTAAPDEQYLSVWEAIRESSEKGLRKAIGKEEEVLAYADESQNSKLRLVDVVGKGMEKFSNEKVQMEAGYDDDKQSNTFSFSVGKFKIEKK